MWLLIPGIGAQGGDLKQVMHTGLTKDKKGLLISASRSIIFSDSPREEAEKLRDDINRLRITRS
jgi:orotidine-5'-phosphate decarboxylase